MMAENNIRVRADLNPDAIDNTQHDDQDPPPPPQNDHDGGRTGTSSSTWSGANDTSIQSGTKQNTGIFGQKGKENITAIVFIRKIEDLARTNCWNDTTTYANVANNLKGFARDWLFATAEMLDWTPAQLTWTNLKPRFQRQFATQTDEKMIMEGLSNLAMKPGESTGELLARITNTMVIIKDTYASYENKPPAPANFDVNNGFHHAGLPTMERRRTQQRPTVPEDAAVPGSFDNRTTKGRGTKKPEHHDLGRHVPDRDRYPAGNRAQNQTSGPTGGRR
jgi:hypothetical protein